MCTVAFLWKDHAHADLIIGMNRDEFRARPSEDVHLWESGATSPIVGGKDLVSGGAWFAFGQNTFAALTNDRGGDSAAPGDRSRGEIVVKAAQAASAEAATAELTGLPASAFGRFHLVVADRTRLTWLTNTIATESNIVAVDVNPGAHVLGNFGLDNLSDPVVHVLLPKIENLGANTSDVPVDAVVDTLERAMSTKGPPGPCIDFGPYGTRSSAIATMFGKTLLRVSDGPPEADAYVDKTRLLAGLVTNEAA